ncbi:MAG: glycoside hydrolase family 2 TIM barrel-domain containing protein [Clostridia bacterium]|nr:glycoside hydrolase family 2 TIM barrel-domain containing protein [Clostridia bacterium]
MKKICISRDWYFSSPERPEKVKVDLPHDYSISLPRNSESTGTASNGFFEGTRGKYVKYMNFGDDEHVILDIDGAYMCSRVLLNDNQLIMHPYGYTPFLVDLTSKMKRNGINKIEISTQNVQPSTRWYSGSGIYRDVFIWLGGKVRIEPWDVFVTTKYADENTAVLSAVIEITSDIEGTITLNSKITDSDGCNKAESNDEIYIKKGKNKTEITYKISNPLLWSTDTPYLYNLNTQIIYEDSEEDSFDLCFGIRTICADAKNGLLLNGKSIKLRGGCIHHDHGALGAASFPAAEYRKLSKLKDAGYNAIRTAHYPPSLTLLEVCDRLGILVMDEAFDMWNIPKNPLDYSLWFADWWERDIKSMVLRDRNHPCVISYSIGNEIHERNCKSDGADWAKKISGEIRKYDSSKLVTSGVCGMWERPEPDAPEEYIVDYMEGHADVGEGNIDSEWDKWTEKYMEPLDIVGYNYLYERYEKDHITYPNRVIWGSETHAVNFYRSWQSVLRNSHVIGDFTWTAYDNLGEAGTGRFLWARDGVINGISLAKYPWRSCYQGDFDLCGYRRPQSYFRESIWKKDCEPKIFTTHPEHYGEEFSGTGWHWYDVKDSWTFDDKYIGKPVKAEVYTDADEIKFILNGKDIGVAKPHEGIASMDVPYEKGELTAVSYKNGKEIKRSSLHTVGAPERVKIAAEKTQIDADNRDLCYIDLYVTDKNGDRVPYAEDELNCICDGGELLCVFSGNPANEDCYTSEKCHAFEGRAIAVIRAKEAGNITLTVGGKGLKSDTVSVCAKPVV